MSPSRLLPAVFLLMLPLGLATSCEEPPWAMPCPEGWVMRADQTCYDPAASDDDSAEEALEATDDDGE